MTDEKTWENAKKVPLKDYEGVYMYFEEMDGYYSDPGDILLDNYAEWPEGVYGTIETPIELDPYDIRERLEESDAAYEDYEMSHEGYDALVDFCERWNRDYADKNYRPDFNIGIVDGLKADNAKLQTKLDASIPVPVDADGVPWTCADVDKSFSLTDGDKATEGTVREIAYAWPREGWWVVDQYDTHYPADKCRHVAPEPPEPPDSQEAIDLDAAKTVCAPAVGVVW